MTDFMDMMATTVTVTPSGASDSYGVLLQGTPFKLQCHILERDYELVSGPGTTVMASHEVWCAPEPPKITRGDVVTLPSGDTATVLRVDKFDDEVGDHHRKIWLGTDIIRGNA